MLNKAFDFNDILNKLQYSDVVKKEIYKKCNFNDDITQVLLKDVLLKLYEIVKNNKDLDSHIVELNVLKTKKFTITEYDTNHIIMIFGKMSQFAYETFNSHKFVELLSTHLRKINYEFYVSYKCKSLYPTPKEKVELK